MFDILKETITLPSTSPALVSLISNYLIRESHINHGNRFRMADVTKMAKERAYLEKLCYRSFPNCISNN